MTRISFYILDEPDDLLFICKLIEKIYRQGLHCYVYHPDQGYLTTLNEKLWTFRDGSFVPHDMAASESADTPVILGAGQPPESANQVLINLGGEVPVFFEQFERLVEVAAGDDQRRNQARARYRYYKERDFPLETHQIN